MISLSAFFPDRLCVYALKLRHCNCWHFSDSGPGQSVTFPPGTASYQVTGLRLGRQYRFTIQPSFQTGLGPETSVDEHPGNSTTSQKFTKPQLCLILTYQNEHLWSQYVWAGVRMWCFWCLRPLIVSVMQDLCEILSPVQLDPWTPLDHVTHRYSFSKM